MTYFGLAESFFASSARFMAKSSKTRTWSSDSWGRRSHVEGWLSNASSNTGCCAANDTTRLLKHRLHTEIGLVKYCANVELTLRVAIEDDGRETR